MVTWDTEKEARWAGSLNKASAVGLRTLYESQDKENAPLLVSVSHNLKNEKFRKTMEKLSAQMSSHKLCQPKVETLRQTSVELPESWMWVSSGLMGSTMALEMKPQMMSQVVNWPGRVYSSNLLGTSALHRAEELRSHAWNFPSSDY